MFIAEARRPSPRRHAPLGFAPHPHPHPHSHPRGRARRHSPTHFAAHPQPPRRRASPSPVSCRVPRVRSLHAAAGACVPILRADRLLGYVSGGALPAARSDFRGRCHWEVVYTLLRTPRGLLRVPLRLRPADAAE
ncbi:hypothetical protein ZWY2020_032327 [Hordeum vulgare]|nr:hypothetical protein ZWY2020_032327 [Hordeum vulgare]